MKNKFSIYFGARVKYFRKLAKITQEQLAEKLNCETTTVSYIESGKNNISFAKLPKLCEALGVEPYQLFVFDYESADIDRISKLIKISESMTEKQFEIVYKLLLDFTNLRPEDVPRSITKDVSIDEN